MRILVLIVLFTSCVHSQQAVDRTLKNIAVKEFMEFERLYYESIDSEKKPDRSNVENSTVYKGVIKSPFDKTEFYLFEYQVFEPALEIVILKNKDVEVLNDYFEAERELLFSDTFINKINSLIAFEDSFKKDALIDLSEFMFKIYYGANQPLKLKSWRDMPHDDKSPVPDSLKNRIHKFERIEESNTVKYSGYIWGPSTSYLYEVDFLYLKQKGSIKIKSNNLGEVGIGLISM